MPDLSTQIFKARPQHKIIYSAENNREIDYFFYYSFILDWFVLRFKMSKNEVKNDETSVSI